MKFAVLSIIPQSESLRKDFVNAIERTKNGVVARIIEKYRSSGADIILATAAADFYIPWVWDGDYVATRLGDNPTKEECRAEEKVVAVRRYMRPDDVLEAVITDHIDDLPLLLVGARNNILVNPSDMLIRELVAHGVSWHDAREFAQSDIV